MAKPAYPSCVNSSPMISPCPRTSARTPGQRACIARSASGNLIPITVAFSHKFSSRVTRIAAIAAAHAKGLPPKVDVCKKGASIKLCHRWGLATIAPIGITPPPSAFAKHRISGTTFSCSTANILPVRPMPVCTSSTMSSTPFRSQISRIAER